MDPTLYVVGWVLQAPTYQQDQTRPFDLMKILGENPLEKRMDSSIPWHQYLQLKKLIFNDRNKLLLLLLLQLKNLLERRLMPPGFSRKLTDLVKLLGNEADSIKGIVSRLYKDVAGGE